MAVYTQLSATDFSKLLTSYDIGELVQFQGIADGVSNTNYLLETTKNKYIATIYENSPDGDVNINNLQFYWLFMEHLSNQGVPCPVPIYNKNNQILQYHSNKHHNDNKTPFAIVSFLNGKWPKSLKNYHCHEVGKILAQTHNASINFTKTLKNPSSVLGLHDVFAQLIADNSPISNDKIKEIDNSLNHIIDNWPKNNIIPSGVIHADLFPDNVFFDNKKISGILDFYLSCNDYYAYDVAITINAWCFEHGTQFNITKAKQLLKGYNLIKPFSESELQYLPILCAGAAIRFYLRRLHDLKNTSKNKNITPKDPNEYLQKLRFHLKVKSHTEYGL